MGILKQQTPWEREFREVWRKEQWFLRRYQERTETALDRKLEEIAPEQLLETLHTAFFKAFEMLFEKGSGLIQRAGRQTARRESYQVNAYAVELRENRQHLRAFSKAAGRAGRGNVALSGAAGVGMGLFGIALPDVVLFTGMLLKNVYETAESYGFPCEGEAERLYALRVIEGALSYGQELRERSQALDRFAQGGAWEETDLTEQIRATARCLSEAVLYGKVLQNIPVVGAAGGLGNAFCMNRVRQYSDIKYHKRFLIARRLA